MVQEKAFPSTGDYFSNQTGMDIRDYFAIRILCTMVGTSHMSEEYLVHQAYNYADKMIERRKMSPDE